MLLKDFSAKNFLGREHELEILKGISMEARAGEADSILLTGKRGIGKTEVLKHLYHHLFNYQNDAVPFLYNVRSALDSIDNFSTDYLCDFILQTLAFLRKDASLTYSGICSLDHLRAVAGDASAQWAVDLIDRFFSVREFNEEVKLFSYAISAPYQSYVNMDLPVVVIIDDFHNLRNLVNDSQIENKNLWVLFENYLQSWHTPHILAGCDTDLQKMFFEDSSIGERLEIIKLTGLNREDSEKLFTLLCDRYSIGYEAELKEYIDLFAGNPFYIKSFVQAARQVSRSISEDEFWDIYVREITKGKIYTYWISLLRAYISDFEMRKPSLNFLQMLFDTESEVVLSGFAEMLSIQKKELEHIINLLNSSGAIQMGFSNLEITDDAILTDIIRGLYHREIRKEHIDRVKDIIVGNRYQPTEIEEAASFDVKIPLAPKAELVAIKTLEQIAGHYRIPPDAIGDLQIALVELFTNMLAMEKEEGKSYDVKFRRTENDFSVIVDTAMSESEIKSGKNEQLFSMLQSQVDDVTLERTRRGTTIILTKKFDKKTTP